jgi:MoxR-like ATPase
MAVNPDNLSSYRKQLAPREQPDVDALTDDGMFHALISPSPSPSPAPSSAHQQLTTVRQYLLDHLFERQAAVLATLAAVVAKEHVFMLGPPGTGKSFLVKLLSSCFTWLEDDGTTVQQRGARYFYYLMQSQTKPAEIWGPQSIKALREDRIRFNTQGHFPECDFAFIDEIWKGNSGVNNGFLNGLNERVFKNGVDVEEIPLRTLFSASNETPGDDSLGALYDRFGVRLWIGPLLNEENVIRMLSAPAVAQPPQLSLDVLDEAYIQSQQVIISDAAMQNLLALRRNIMFDDEYADLTLSDRRLKTLISILKASVWLDGRTVAEGDDIMYVRHCVWDEQPQIEQVEDLINSLCSDERMVVNESVRLLRGILAKIPTATVGHDANALLAEAAKVEATLTALNQQSRVVRNAMAVAIGTANKARKKYAKIVGSEYKPADMPIEYTDEFDCGF